MRASCPSLGAEQAFGWVWREVKVCLLLCFVAGFQARLHRDPVLNLRALSEEEQRKDRPDSEGRLGGRRHGGGPSSTSASRWRLLEDVLPVSDTSS